MQCSAVVPHDSSHVRGKCDRSALYYAEGAREHLLIIAATNSYCSTVRYLGRHEEKKNIIRIHSQHRSTLREGHEITTVHNSSNPTRLLFT
jgi:hypothetical protein